MEIWHFKSENHCCDVVESGTFVVNGLNTYFAIFTSFSDTLAGLAGNKVALSEFITVSKGGTCRPLLDLSIKRGPIKYRCVSNGELTFQ